MIELIAYGTIWFWIALIVTGIVITYFLEDALSNDSDDGGGFKSTVTVAAFIVAYYLFGSKSDVINAFHFIRENPSLILTYFFLYLIVGVIWSIIKWYFFLLNKRDEAKQVGRHFDLDDVPKAARNKKRIISWMTYWFFSMFWTLTNEPIRRSFKFTYNRIEKLYDSMSDRIFSDLIKEKEAKKK